jgi:hypothetical protein
MHIFLLACSLVVGRKVRMGVQRKNDERLKAKVRWETEAANAAKTLPAPTLLVLKERIEWPSTRFVYLIFYTIKLSRTCWKDMSDIGDGSVVLARFSMRNGCLAINASVSIHEDFVWQAEVQGRSLLQCHFGLENGLDSVSSVSKLVSVIDKGGICCGTSFFLSWCWEKGSSWIVQVCMSMWSYTKLTGNVTAGKTVVARFWWPHNSLRLLCSVRCWTWAMLGVCRVPQNPECITEQSQSAIWGQSYTSKQQGELALPHHTTEDCLKASTELQAMPQ